MTPQTRISSPQKYASPVKFRPSHGIVIQPSQRPGGAGFAAGAKLEGTSEDENASAWMPSGDRNQYGAIAGLDTRCWIAANAGTTTAASTDRVFFYSFAARMFHAL
jgi:hypothetical protein